jgi:hypothetical protein
MDNWKRDRIIEIIYLMEKKEVDESWIRNKLSEYGVPQKFMHGNNTYDLLEICPVDVISRLNSEIRKMEKEILLSPIYDAEIEKKLVKSVSKKHARVFIYLALDGEKTAPQIAKGLQLPITETYHILTVLQNKGIVTSSFEKPSIFKAVSRQEALKRLAKESKK